MPRSGGKRRRKPRRARTQGVGSSANLAILALIVGALFVAVVGQNTVSYVVAAGMLVVAWVVGNSS